MVGECLLPLLAEAGWRATAFSRQAVDDKATGVQWRRLSELRSPIRPSGESPEKIAWWISIFSLTALPEYLDALRAHGARRVVALSSTSRFTKAASADPAEQALAQRLAEAETRLQAWAECLGVEWVILRPTLIYGRGRDRNISEIAQFIRRYRFFPVLGRASGLRQPVHSEDVAAACLAALDAAAAKNRAYNISGGETMTYWEMVRRVFLALGRKPRIVPVPLWTFRLAIGCLRLLPRYRDWSSTKAERMEHDLVFDHVAAKRDLAFNPGPFVLSAHDVPGEPVEEAATAF
jgi:nucleoside-diphosphate-sugar epimerase